MSDRTEELQRHGRAYGELHLAVAFTAGMEGDNAKRVTSQGWDRTERLPDGAFGAALLAGRGLKRNPAVVLRPSGLIGVDIDGPEGVAHLRRIVPEGMPRTVTVETGKDAGYHLWYRPPAGTSSRIVFIELGTVTPESPSGIRPKTGQYLVCPPALHPSGRVYGFAEGRAPWDMLPAVLPADVLLRLERAAKVERRQRVTSAGQIPAGGRHDHLMRLGCAMLARGACLEAVEAALLAQNEHRCMPPKAAELVQALAHDLTDRYGPEPT